MTRALERRARRMFGLASGRLGKSKSVIWCFDPEHMPAMIDLLIAKGDLSENDRPHCVHWRAVKGAGEATQEDIARSLDGDAMLEEAGIPTITGETYKAWKRGPQVLEALYREWLDGPTPDDLKSLADFKFKVGKGTSAIERRPLAVTEPEDTSAARLYFRCI